MQQLKPLDSAARVTVRAATVEFIERAGDFFAVTIPPISVRFDLRGRSAGQYRRRGSEAAIRYNPWIFAKYFDANLAETVPHEVAHYVTDWCFGAERTRPHGREWREVMRILGAEPKVTCSFDLEGVPIRRLRRYVYRCGCREHEITAIRHGRMSRGQAEYRCRSCRRPLSYVAPAPHHH